MHERKNEIKKIKSKTSHNCECDWSGERKTGERVRSAFSSAFCLFYASRTAVGCTAKHRNAYFIKFMIFFLFIFSVAHTHSTKRLYFHLLRSNEIVCARVCLRVSANSNRTFEHQGLIKVCAHIWSKIYKQMHMSISSAFARTHTVPVPTETS